MIDFWNDRYGAEEFAYGTLPNDFFKVELSKLEPGSILLPAEGEGRNAIYAAKNGFNVSAFDISIRGQKKALHLAKSQKVEIDYSIARLQDFDFGKEKFDAISFIYVHMESDTRTYVHTKAVNALKPRGRIILEAFNKNQLGNESGGPKDIDWLFSKDQIKDDFKDLKIEILEETQTTLAEGPYHSGEADVIRFVGVKA